MNKRVVRGFTLIELIVFIVVVGVGLTGILSVMNTVVKSSADPVVRKQVIALADSTMEEVMQKAYTDPDGVQGNEATRDAMDDVDDYDGKTEAIFGLPAALAGYSIRISVTADNVTLGIMAKKVVVTVSKGTESFALASYRTNN
ncbi:prepilin-type N-terminal cleavage/methylation domain-containing protein [Rhodoferax saidenbachensis]|uniref:MSHA pilin protein MshD n=1 Tax=Rhodoferax saidenbachensis TaxID=1484693 RepID=A0ABU1ZN60_9BURK|nr:prepilin-type N-terminal cleavage/methylation domain-containing protein [Rhodoferax saidenbachensis]MDR7306969.1 MSHA pilin protein MshD [Rhodoferax saidenbachensis]